ncbi:bifunctional adenosylcobinamide kinase/adenosylcobinamide-phosphate guanylyltransferase [Rhodococcus triatomae]|uniref:Adenosylcobinamide kinase n=1 Tax=Rhodococcus triatomae TaxID=300028 RepID=A0A1G8NKT1_9NOCA|nr:bifunctional adenosylcobinamide kinase/adenosylcobinamide-phosphate guanylyltransferase [Rhodococcus triatomae]QNG21478.1 bifunctional adenosylcobinamide kinase/adenosylcobinamide-phosphate guanylyltransferase [Rhodococcus triatomae]QNG25781.1 bifunctional adenosylcobinamide kinase/adenosylcobinamide-phosphate guanylyltransferase [Rhodococcus triatomae]SDI80762.1 adenosylcobinamide kinase / adenosylcobinamide-phosphate guanylyltransferase [Rhodococcus triatomae]
MEVLLLGTGAADGWPNPFCTCASCRKALAHGRIREQTAALVDETLLLDCGPEVPRAALRYGRSLSGVRHLLITHAHFDHLGPQALLQRSWADGAGPLDLVGPADALEACRTWVGPDDPVRFVPVAAGDSLTVGDYRVRVLAAEHRVFRDGDAVLYDVEGAGGRILWACDTGPLPAHWYGHVADAGFDAVFLEETFGDRLDHGTDHHDLPAFAHTVEKLRECGAVRDDTDVVAVHLGHHNPDIDTLRLRLSESGARPGTDGEVMVVGEPIGRRTLVLGGARSGKSRHAERLLEPYGAVTYVATGGIREGDAEWAQRVTLHRDRRPSSWSTLETVDVAQVLREAREPLLIDCLGTWLTAMLDRHGVWDGGDVTATSRDVDDLLDAWTACRVPVVAVSNEVGSGVVPASASGRLFRDLLGRVNAAVAERSDTVTLLVAGLPVPLR